MTPRQIIVSCFLFLVSMWTYSEAAIAPKCGVGLEKRLRIDLDQVEAILGRAALDQGRFPQSWDEVGSFQSDSLLVLPPIDPWGNNYYLAGSVDGGYCTIGSLGADGQLGGTGVCADVLRQLEFAALTD